MAMVFIEKGAAGCYNKGDGRFMLNYRMETR